MKKNLDPKLLLFLSVDIINSTQYKQDIENKDKKKILHWLPFFIDFYKDFPASFIKNCILLNQSEPIQCPTIPSLWKSLGDELIFSIVLTHHRQALFYIKAFREAIRQYKKGIRIPSLSLKATSWLAGFPVRNVEIKITSDSLHNKVDYIGPLMDIGFRLTKYSDERKFVVSADLALMALETSSPLKFYYDGKQELKGVLNRTPYPIIWVDMEEENQEKESEQILINKNPANPWELKKFCEEFIQKTGKPLLRPFIEGDEIFKVKPEDYDLELEEVRKKYSDYYAEGDGENSEDASESSNNPTKINNILDNF